MTIQETIKGLQEESAKDPAFSAVCHVFAARERARNQVTVPALTQKMNGEGFKFERQDYARVLRKLSSLGFGELQFHGKRVEALVNLKITLQSIGLVAIKQSAKLERFKVRNKYEALASKEVMAIPATSASSTPGAGCPISITVVVNGKPVNLRIPNAMDAYDIGKLVVKFRDEPLESVLTGVVEKGK